MKRTRSRNMARAAVLWAGILLSMAGLSTSALAASSSASGTGASATAQWNWVGTASISVYYRVVDDTACDNHDVYMFVRVYSVLNPNGTDVFVLRNSNGCNHGVGSTETRRWDASNNITGARVWVCVDDALRDTCYRGNFIDNPNT